MGWFKGSLGIAILTAILVDRIGGFGTPAGEAAAFEAHQAYNGVFALCGLIGLALLGLAALFSPRTAEMQANAVARAAEHKELVNDR